MDELRCAICNGPLTDSDYVGDDFPQLKIGNEFKSVHLACGYDAGVLSVELHPAGTHERIADLERRLAASHENGRDAINEADANAARIAALEAERDELREQVGGLKVYIQSLLGLLRSAGGDDSREYQLAIESVVLMGIISRDAAINLGWGAVPDGDISAPFTEAEARHALTGEHDDATAEPGGLSPLDAYLDAIARVAQVEDALLDAEGDQTMAEFDLPIWADNERHDLVFGTGDGYALQPMYGPHQELPF